MNPAEKRDVTSSWLNRHHSTEDTPLIEMPAAANVGPTLANISELDGDDDADVQPQLQPRAGVDDGLLDTIPPPTRPDKSPRTTPVPAGFPYAPGFAPDLENGIIIPELESIPDVNQYQHRKTLAQGMMDLALFSANANQLRYVLESFNRHPYYYPSLILISFSILLQVAIGLGLILNSRYNVKDAKEICIANKINNYTVIGIFLVTTVNVFVSAFGVANAEAPPQPPLPPPIPWPPVTPSAQPPR